MVVGSNVNPNYPLPGIDQSSRGFRDNFSTIKNEIENLQGKQINFVGGLFGTANVSIGNGTSPIVINAVLNTTPYISSVNQNYFTVTSSNVLTMSNPITNDVIINNANIIVNGSYGIIINGGRGITVNNGPVVVGNSGILNAGGLQNFGGITNNSGNFNNTAGDAIFSGGNVYINGNFVTNGLIGRSSNVLITAGGLTQTNATPISNNVCVINICSNGGGIILPDVTPIMTKYAETVEFTIVNRATNIAKIYPYYGARFEANVANVSTNVSINSTVHILMTSPTQGYII